MLKCVDDRSFNEGKIFQENNELRHSFSPFVCGGGLMIICWPEHETFFFSLVRRWQDNKNTLTEIFSYQSSSKESPVAPKRLSRIKKNAKLFKCDLFCIISDP